MAAAEPVGEPAFGHLVSHVKVADVATRVGVSRAAIYKLWPAQHDFLVDLATYLLTEEDDDPWIVSGVVGLASEIDPSAPDLFEATRVWFGRVQQSLAGDPRLVLRSASLAYPLPEDVAMRRTELERRYRRTAARAVRQALETTGRRPVSSLTVDDLTLAIVMLVDGSAMLSWNAPELVRSRTPTPDDGEPPWSALAYAVRCVLTGLTEPGVIHPAPDRQAPDRQAPTDGWQTRPWTPAQRRALEAGAQIMAELISRVGRDDERHEDRSDVLGHVTMDRVARAAGVSRRHLYNLWSSQSEFRADLLSHLSQREFADYFADFDDAALEAMVQLSDPVDLALAIGEMVNEERPSTDGQAMRARFAFRGQLTDPGVRGRVQRNLERAIDEQSRRLAGFEDLVDPDSEVVLDGEQVSLLLLITAGGSERLNRIDPVTVRAKLPYRGGRWSLFSIVCQTIISHSIGSS